MSGHARMMKAEKVERTIAALKAIAEEYKYHSFAMEAHGRPQRWVMVDVIMDAIALLEEKVEER